MPWIETCTISIKYNFFRKIGRIANLVSKSSKYSKLLPTKFSARSDQSSGQGINFSEKRAKSALYRDVQRLLRALPEALLINELNKLREHSRAVIREGGAYVTH